MIAVVKDIVEPSVANPRVETIEQIGGKCGSHATSAVTLKTMRLKSKPTMIDVGIDLTLSNVVRAWRTVYLVTMPGGPGISAANSEVSVWVIPTDEELMIARHTAAAVAVAPVETTDV